MRIIFQKYSNLHLAVMLLTVFFLFTTCTKEPSKPKEVTIAWLKALKAEQIDKAALEQDYVVKGYFVNETVPILISDMKLTLINSPIPDSSYILLTGKGIEEFSKEEGSYGTFIELTGKIDLRKQKEIEGFELEMICPDIPKILRKSEYVRPIVYDICKKYPLICKIPPLFLKNKFALLYSGGINSVNAHTRYWNDLKFMYLTLRNKYGYSDDNIVVVYKNGTGEDTDMTVDFAASPTGLNDAINYLRGKMTLRDDFYFFVTNHGGGYHQGEATNRGGRIDSTPGDEIDAQKYDEAIYYYGQTTNDIWDDDLSNWINSMDFATMTAVLEPCFSGGLIHDLKGCNRVIISACSEFEYSWSGAPGDHDMFSYHFNCALIEADHTGAALSPNPDTNGDGSVSILEAFLYAKSKDTAGETPFLEDNGDGVGTNTPTATGVDGSVANTRKL